MSIVDTLPETSLVIDTDIFSHLRNKQPYVLDKLKDYISDTKQFPAISSITIFEAVQGIEKELFQKKILDAQAQKFKQRIDELIQIHKVLSFDAEASKIASYIFPRLSQTERNKHWRDLFIVSIALANNYGLASQNRKDIELIAKHLPENYKNLRLAVWKP